MEPMDPRNIVVTGFMGAGKDSVALRVADGLGRDYYNSDLVFEERFGPITKYLPKREHLFRQHEGTIFRELLAQRSTVIATGGGTLIDQTNCDLARERGIVVWLNVDFNVAAERVKGDKKNKRPLFDEHVRGRFRFRQALYQRAAHIEVDANRDLDDVARDVLQALSEY